MIDLGRDAEGRRRQYTRDGFRTRAAARAALAEYLQQAGAGVQPHSLTMEAYLQEWLASKRSLRPSTRRSYAGHVRLYWIPELGHVRLRELTPTQVDRALDDMVGRGLTPENLARVYATLRSAMNAAVRRRLIPYNPAQYVDLPQRRRTRPGIWSVEQMQSFFAAAARDRTFAFFVLAAVTGMRRGELVGLRWEDVELTKRRLNVVQTIVDLGERVLIVGPPKSETGSRVIALDAATVEVLVGHRQRQQAEQRAWGPAWEASGLVFTREDGRMMRPDFFSRQFRRLTRSAGLPVIRLHDLRHSNATLALQAGVASKIVSERLGHSTTHFTQDVYQQVNETTAQDAADAIAELLGIGALVHQSAEGAPMASRQPADAPHVGEMLASGPDLGSPAIA